MTLLRQKTLVLCAFFLSLSESHAELKAPKGKSTPEQQAVKAMTGKWWLPIQPWSIPMCFFVDPSVDEKKTNEKIKKMANAYASCGIFLKTFTFTLRKDYPRNYKKISEAAKIACPLNSEFGVRGAIQVTARFDELPQQMCQNSHAKGCSTLCSPLSISFVTADSDPALALHESMHSNCCGPLCVDSGEGGGRRAGPDIELASTSSLKTLDVAQAAVKINDYSMYITEQGCEALRAGASSNETFRWQRRNNPVYYSKETSVSKQYDLMAMKSFFRYGEMLPANEVLREAPKQVVVDDSKLSGGVRRLLKNVKETKVEPETEPAETMVRPEIPGRLYLENLKLIYQKSGRSSELMREVASDPSEMVSEEVESENLPVEQPNQSATLPPVSVEAP